MQKDFLSEIKALIDRFKGSCIYKLTEEQKQFVDESTPLLKSPEFKLGTKLNWVLNGRTSFPKCKTCGKELKQNVGPSAAYSTYCSRKCANNDPEIKAKIKKKTVETCLERYGVVNVFQSEEAKEKSKKTCLAKYGVEFSAQAECVKKKLAGAFSENGNPFAREEVKAKIKKTLKERYGVEHPLQSEEFLKKSQETCKKHYGVDSPLQSAKIQEKTKQTCLEKYGTCYPGQNEEVKKKIKKTSAKKWRWNRLCFFKDSRKNPGKSLREVWN